MIAAPANCAKTLEPALATHAAASIGRSMAKAARARPRLTGAAPRPACGLLATAANKRSRLPSALRISWFGSGAGRGLPGLLRLGFGLMLRTGVSPSTTKSERRWTVAVLGRLLGRRQPLPLRPAAASIDHRLPRADDHALPAIVVRAREDARSRLALARLGYVSVRAHYAQCKRQGQETFSGLEHEHLAPAMDLVRDWLMEERKRIFARARWPFLMTMLVTIVAGIVFVAVARVLD
jgi:hypothetical protein